MPLGNLIVQPQGAWDGTFSLGALIDLSPNLPLTLRHSSGLQSIAIGISGFDHSHELIVNGQNLGAVDSLPNFQPSITNGRNVYVRMDRGPGDPPITVIALVPDPAMANPFGDNVRIDHVAFAVVSAAPVLLAPLLLVLFLGLGAVAALKLEPSLYPSFFLDRRGRCGAVFAK